MSVVTRMVTVNSTSGKTTQSTCSNKRRKEHTDDQHIPQQNEECEYRIQLHKVQGPSERCFSLALK